MITLSNGHKLEYVVASGALGFDGKGWFWERPLVCLRLIELELFSIGHRTLTRQPRLYPVSNLSWIRPWTWLPWSSQSCVQLLPNGGAVNKVGLYNPGIDWWCEKVGPKLTQRELLRSIGSIYGSKNELVEMARMLNDFPLAAIEINDSCPNTGHTLAQAETVIESVKSVRMVSNHPIIIKVSVDQDYLTIAKGLVGIAEAISLNSVPWKIIFPEKESPLTKIGKPGSGGGGISGKPAQLENWTAVQVLMKEKSLPVIAPSIMSYYDLGVVKALGAEAFSFGAIHLRTPWKPTSIVKRANRSEEFDKLSDALN